MSKVPATWVDIAIQLKNASRPLDGKGVGHLTQADLVLSWIAAAREEARAEALRDATMHESGATLMAYWAAKYPGDNRGPMRDALQYFLICRRHLLPNNPPPQPS